MCYDSPGWKGKERIDAGKGSPLSFSSCNEILGNHNYAYRPGEEFPPHPITPYSFPVSNDGSDNSSEHTYRGASEDNIYDPNQHAHPSFSTVIERKFGEYTSHLAGFGDQSDDFSSLDRLPDSSVQLTQSISEPRDPDYDFTSSAAALNFWEIDDHSVSPEVDFPIPISLPLSPFSSCDAEVPRNPTLSSTPSPYGVLDHTVQRDIGTSVAFMGNGSPALDAHAPIYPPPVNVGPIRRPRKRHRTDIRSRYTCKRCGENFTTTTNYNRHKSASKCSSEINRAVASNPTRYKCGFLGCQKTYSRKDNRDKHERDKHGLQAGGFNAGEDLEEERNLSLGSFGTYDSMEVAFPGL